MSCAVIGDSIAQGVAAQMPQCAALAHKGWTSARWRHQYQTRRIDADRVVISLGSNDFGADTGPTLESIRAQVKARQVVWIAPAHHAAPVLAVAAAHGDAVVPIPALSPDSIHPTPRGYRQIAREITRKDAA